MSKGHVKITNARKYASDERFATDDDLEHLKQRAGKCA